MKMLRLLLAAALILAPFEQALAGAGTITTKDAAGATRTFVIVTDGTGNFVAPTVVCDAAAAATCAAVGANGMAVSATQTGTWNVTNISGTVSLPTGAATSALQTTGNTTLTTINTTLGSPFQAGGSIGNTTFAVTNAGTFAAQLTGATNNINNIAGTVSLPTGASTAAKQPALGTAGAASADVISVQGIASMTPLLANPGTAANWGVGTATQNSASVANGQLALAQFNTTPTTITTGNMSPLQMDNAGKLLVNCTGCSSSSAITSWGGGTLGAMANYGTSPGAVLAPGVNAFVTNSNANGSAVSASSSPVVIASDQAAVATKAASTAFASGSLVDITNMSAATAAAPPAKAIYLGANASGATGGLLAGLVQCDSKAVYDASTSGSTELVALTSGRSVYVCGYTIMAGGTVSVKLIYGTGTACATGSNNLTPAYPLTAQAGISDPSPFYRGMKTASANALCLNASTGVAAQAIVYYSII